LSGSLRNSSTCFWRNFGKTKRSFSWRNWTSQSWL